MGLLQRARDGKIFRGVVYDLENSGHKGCSLFSFGNLLGYRAQALGVDWAQFFKVEQRLVRAMPADQFFPKKCLPCHFRGISGYAIRIDKLLQFFLVMRMSPLMSSKETQALFAGVSAVKKAVYCLLE